MIIFKISQRYLSSATDTRLGSQVKEYFQELQKNLSDSRDKRGQRHNLAFVLTSFLMAILRTTRRLDLSCIHRRMVKEHDLMVQDTSYKAHRCISYRGRPCGSAGENIG